MHRSHRRSRLGVPPPGSNAQSPERHDDLMVRGPPLNWRLSPSEWGKLAVPVRGRSLFLIPEKRISPAPEETITPVTSMGALAKVDVAYASSREPGTLPPKWQTRFPRNDALPKTPCREGRSKVLNLAVH